jgi:hypothetical protein
MSAGKLDITIEQGATFRKTLTWQDSAGAPIDLTGFTARMMIRQQLKDAAPLITLTTENGGITLGGVAGTIALYISDTDTEAMTIQKGVYDLELEAGGSGDVTRLVEGKVTMSLEVTR